MKFDLIYIVTNSVMMLLSDLFVSSRCFRHRLGCDNHLLLKCRRLLLTHQ
ncbi:hypothetical protein HanXRQr2_Chr13g0592621 [Helianthus annuus]|uniref:Uncharacterized protein n=1 Tax=Helianthus annuus TaxID=4232 RepID=A0A9K3EIP9_HELAN|nr:hypothetical protein HanXRQr2_Chr13g0592621 [Helianthus annuus]